MADRPPQKRAEKHACRCDESRAYIDDDIVVQLCAEGDSVWVPLDTGLIWVDRPWYEGVGGTWVPTEETATAADGHHISFCSNGELTLRPWGTTFVEPVRIAENLPSRVLIGSRFWRCYGLVLNLSSLRAEIWVEGRCIRGKVTKTRTNKASPELIAAISDADVDTTILDMELFQFHQEKAVL